MQGNPSDYTGHSHLHMHILRVEAFCYFPFLLFIFLDYCLNLFWKKSLHLPLHNQNKQKCSFLVDDHQAYTAIKYDQHFEAQQVYIMQPSPITVHIQITIITTRAHTQKKKGNKKKTDGNSTLKLRTNVHEHSHKMMIGNRMYVSTEAKSQW